MHTELCNILGLLITNVKVESRAKTKASSKYAHIERVGDLGEGFGW